MDASVVSSMAATSAIWKPEDVAEHEYDALARWKTLEGGDERQPDRLSGLVARVGPGRGRGDALEQDVGVGLERDRFAVSGRFGRLSHGFECGWPAPAIAHCSTPRGSARSRSTRRR